MPNRKVGILYIAQYIKLFIIFLINLSKDKKLTYLRDVHNDLSTGIFFKIPKLIAG